MKTLTEMALAVMKRFELTESDVTGRFMGIEPPVMPYEYSFYIGGGKMVHLYCDAKVFYVEFHGAAEKCATEADVFDSLEKFRKAAT